MNLLAVVLAAASMGTTAQAPSCAYGLRIGERTYVGGYGVGDGPRARGRVDVIFPACAEGGDTGNAADIPGVAQRIDGVPLRVGVYADGQLYIADGQLTALARHPLHPYVAPGPGLRQECMPHAVVSGTVGFARENRMVIQDAAVTVDAQTRTRFAPTADLTGGFVHLDVQDCSGGELVADVIGP